MQQTSSHVSLRTWIRNAPWKKYLKEGAKAVVKSPLNFLVFFLAVNVVLWGAFLVLLLAGWVKVGDDDTQKLWIEIASQVLNSIFTLAAVPVHPKRFLGLVRALTIWRQEKGIRSQFLALFLEQHHQARLAQDKDLSSLPRTLDESREELLDMVSYFNAFPQHGRERVALHSTCNTAAPKEGKGECATTHELSHEYATESISDKHPALLNSTNTRTSSTDATPPFDADQPPSPPPHLQRQPTTLHVDIPEQELDNLLAHETQHVVHSVVLPFLPLSPSLPQSQGPTLDIFVEAASPTDGEPPAPSSLIHTVSAHSPSRSQSSTGTRRSSRTRARTLTMTRKDADADVEDRSRNDDTEKPSKAGRGTLPRRPTYVVRETSETVMTRKDLGATDDDATEVGIMPEPLPLTPEQIEWLDERQRGLNKRQAKLQKAWPWYTYTIPAGIEPIDFMVSSPSSCKPMTSTGVAAERPLLVQSPCNLLMKTSLACLLLASFNLNSMIQEVLCGFMWGWNYKTRPGWVTGTGMAIGCVSAMVPSIMILLHEQKLSKARVVASAEEAIQDAIDSQPLT